MWWESGVARTGVGDVETTPHFSIIHRYVANVPTHRQHNGNATQICCQKLDVYRLHRLVINSPQGCCFTSFAVVYVYTICYAMCMHASGVNICLTKSGLKSHPSHQEATSYVT